MLLFNRSSWRLIQSPPDHGAWNMALDEAILEATASAEVLPTLRLYAWQPACLSLGYAQPISDVDLQKLHANGWELVRRPTGGRAILHIDELTYSVCGPQDEPRLAGSILESYRTLSAALLAALHRMEIPAQALPKNDTLNPERSRSDQNPVCFETPSNYEITVAGKKLIGSAQARRSFSHARTLEIERGAPGTDRSDSNRDCHTGVLQHGSLPLYGDLTRITQALLFPDHTARQRAAERLLNRATTAELALGQILSWEEAACAIRTAFEQSLNLDLIQSELTSNELHRAEQLYREKYANPAWTEKN